MKGAENKYHFLLFFYIIVLCFTLACAQTNQINQTNQEKKIKIESVSTEISNSNPSEPQSSTSDSSEDEKEIIAEGKATISQITKDLVKAEEEAIRNAKRNAVEQGIGTFVASQTIVEKHKLISDKIFTKTDGYVKSYTKLSGKQDGEIYTVTIKAIVKCGDLKNDLIAIGILKQQLKNPTIMVIGIEKFSGKELDQLIMGNILNDKLLEKTFDLVDREQMEALSKRDVEGAMDDLNLAATLARRFKADILISYKANVTNDGSEYNSILKSNLNKATANITCKVVDSSSARLVCTETVRQLGTSDGSPESAANRALEIAGNLLSDKLIPKILNAWQDRGFGAGQWIEVRITNIPFGEQQKLISALRKTSGVNQVKDPQMENGVMMFAVQGNMTGSDLATKISELKDFNLEIVSYAQNSVVAKKK